MSRSRSLGSPEGVEIVGAEALPLIIRAVDGKDSVEYLRGWITANRNWLEEKMVEHGMAM
jgi:hypothetical protein